MKPAAILFDLDGTLVDSLADIADAVNRVLKAQGFPVHPTQAYRWLVGEGVYTLAWRALPETARDSDVVARTVTALQEDYGRNWAVKTRAYDGIPGVLARISGLSIPMAVLSNKPDAVTRRVVERFLPGVPFQAVMGLRPDAQRKPDPSSALELAAGMGVDAAACWFVGDSLIDMLTARAAGMLPVGVLWGFRDRAELEENGAAHVLACPEQLLALLGARGAR
jgi:phosphoglycolate phosphatase